MSESIHDLLTEIQSDSGGAVVFASVDSGVAFFKNTWKVFFADADARIFDYKCNGCGGVCSCRCRCRGYYSV